MIVTKDIYNGGGYLYDDGDVPSCNYCGCSAKDKTIFSSSHSGVLLCDENDCLLSYAREMVVTEELTHSTETMIICDVCDEECYDANSTDEEHFCCFDCRSSIEE